MPIEISSTSSSQVTPVVKSVQPPLIEKTRTETDPTTGSQIRVTEFRRGLLASETLEFDDPYAFFQSLSAPRKTPRESLEEFTNSIRDNLEKRDLPTDRQPFWICSEHGKWRPLEKEDSPLRDKLARSRWTSRLKELTAPLSKERAAGELLETLAELLRIPDIDKHLRLIGRAMDRYGDYRIAGSVNALAHQGVMARKGRAQGPVAKRERAGAIRAVVLDCAESFWRAYPALRGDVSNTAASVAELVNEKLRSADLVSAVRRGLSAKTIGDHIRHGIRG
jgi:hypothetical protein